MKTTLTLRTRLLAILFLFAIVHPSLLAQGTAFTYQGRLNNSSVPANGIYDLTFTLFQYDTGGNVILGPLTNTAVTLSNGLFTAVLDFGPYDSSAYGRGRWLEISVRTNGSGPFTILAPRQQMTPAPSAIFANYALHSAPGSGFNADLLNGLDSSAFWKLDGNAGTVAGTHFLGTIDNQALEFKANGMRGLRIEPTAVGVNFIAGNSNNTISADSSYATIGGGTHNIIGSDAASAVINGGTDNYITLAGELSVIAGGSENGMEATYGCSIGGGLHNRITGNGVGVRGGSIIGGALNQISADGLNVVGTYCPTVLGGAYNWANSDVATAAGYRAKAVHPGSFVWSDFNEADFSSSSSNQFLIRAGGGVGVGVNAPQQQLSVAAGMNIDQNNANSGSTINALTFGSGSGEAIGSKRTPGGDQYGLDFYSNFLKRMSILNNGNVGIGTDTPSQKLHVIGNILASGTITPNSDRNQKTAFAPIDPASVLDGVVRMPIQQWRFKSEPEDVKHVGPMAQDFRAAFGLGEIPTAIATVDADGVALAAIQGLNGKLEGASEKAESAIRKLQSENAELKSRLEKLEQLMAEKLQSQSE